VEIVSKSAALWEVHRIFLMFVAVLGECSGLGTMNS